MIGINKKFFNTETRRNRDTERRKYKNNLRVSVFPCLRVKKQYCQSGFTLLELIITLTIISILAAGTFPVARNYIKRGKEIELRRSLREIRQAIDKYKSVCDARLVSKLDQRVEDECYPPTLEILVEGIHPVNKPTTTIKFLRRIPKDPFTDSTEWGMRSVQDDTDSYSWGGQNVYDVFSKAEGKALDGKTEYKNW